MTALSQDILDIAARHAHHACANAPGAGGAAVIILRERDDSAAVAMHGNAREIAAIALTALGMALTKPRPEACDVCADAWDRMQMARALLRDIAGECA